MKTYTEEFKKTIVELYENGNKKIVYYIVCKLFKIKK